jgi:hypothetical protein
MHRTPSKKALDAIKAASLTNTNAYVLSFMYVARLVTVGLVVYFQVVRPGAKVDGPPVTEDQPKV